MEIDKKQLITIVIILDLVIIIAFLVWYFFYSNHTEKTSSLPTWLVINSHENHSMMDHSQMDHGSMVSGEESFLKLMIPHHQEAIDTSKIVLAKTQSPELKTLLENIISAQETEVQIMKKTVENLYKNDTEFQYMPMMNPNLANLSSLEAEKSYLEGMIIHHKWAIQMAQAMQGKDMQDATRKIVENIIASQQSEIDLMKKYLKNY